MNIFVTLLLLFNVESVRQNGQNSEWFPFDKFKYNCGNKVVWSLEHIHAQQSEVMRTQEVWKEWLKLHIPSVQSVDNNQVELIKDMQEAIEKPKLDGTEFTGLQQRVVELLSAKGNTEYLHSIGNMALLNSSDNAALNNSTFDVKRIDELVLRQFRENRILCQSDRFSISKAPLFSTPFPSWKVCMRPAKESHNHFTLTRI